jgi:hypothetical protein
LRSTFPNLLLDDHEKFLAPANVLPAIEVTEVVPLNVLFFYWNGSNSSATSAFEGRRAEIFVQ